MKVICTLFRFFYEYLTCFKTHLKDDPNNHIKETLENITKCNFNSMELTTSTSKLDHVRRIFGDILFFIQMNMELIPEIGCCQWASVIILCSWCRWSWSCMVESSFSANYVMAQTHHYLELNCKLLSSVFYSKKCSIFIRNTYAVLAERISSLCVQFNFLSNSRLSVNEKLLISPRFSSTIYCVFYYIALLSTLTGKVTAACQRIQGF